jgi:hypothetical protein
MQRVRSLEDGPGGEPARAAVPVGNDAVALDGRAAPARECVPSGNDQVGPRECSVDVAVGERALGDDLALLRVEDGLEGLVLDLDQLECILRRVAILGDDHRERLAHVPCDVRGCGVVRRRPPDADRKRP